MKQADRHLGVLTEVPISLKVVAHRQDGGTRLLAGQEDFTHEVHEAVGFEPDHVFGLQLDERPSQQGLDAGIVELVAIAS